MNAVINDIRDVRPPVDVPGAPWWIWFLLAAVVFLVFALRWWQQYRLRSNESAPQTSWEIAYEHLADLERQDLFRLGRVKEYFSALSDITRRYIEDRFNIHAPEMTTEEFLNSVKANPFIENKHKDILRKFLNLSDMVKFAKYGASSAEARESLELARRFVDETKVEETPKPAAP
jgi:hypothetical protein